MRRAAARLQRRLSSVTATTSSSSSSLGGGDVHPQSSLFLLKRYLSAAAAVPEQKLSMDDKNFLDGSYVRRSSLLFLVVVYSPLLLCLLFNSDINRTWSFCQQDRSDIGLRTIESSVRRWCHRNRSILRCRRLTISTTGTLALSWNERRRNRKRNKRNY